MNGAQMNVRRASYRRLYAARVPDDAAADDPNAPAEAEIDVPAERARRLADLDALRERGVDPYPVELRP